MPENECGQPTNESEILNEVPPNSYHLHELHKLFPDDIPDSVRESNMTMLWACKSIFRMLDMGEPRSSPKIQSLVSLINIELHWMKENREEIKRQAAKAPQHAVRFEKRGRPPLEIPDSFYQRLKDVGLPYNHEKQAWCGWQTDEMVIVANELLTTQGRLL